jgi:hypothetical protein
MSLFKNLFKHPRASETVSSNLVSWPGQSGKQYSYEIHPIEDSFQPLAGNYIYAKQGEDGSWIPVYIAQTRGLHQRLEGHVRTEDVVQMGATHIHVHFDSAGQAARCSEEHDLVLRWHPVCNDTVET